MRKEKNVLWKLTERYILQIEFEKARLHSNKENELLIKVIDLIHMNILQN